nr:hypothetical protein [uncultured Corynebacterium sp.]
MTMKYSFVAKPKLDFLDSEGVPRRRKARTPASVTMQQNAVAYPPAA